MARMKILVAGDIHSNRDHMRYLFNVADYHKVDAIYAVGDFGYWPRYKVGEEFLKVIETESEVPIFFCDGNHEDHALLPKGAKVSSVMIDLDGTYSEKIFYTPRGYTWEWGSLKFGAMGGAHSIDKDLRQAGFDWFREELITEDDLRRCVAPVDVMFTHDAPTWAPVFDKMLLNRGCPAKDDKETLSNRRMLDNACDIMNPIVLIHGHYHLNYSATVGGVRVRGLDCDGTKGSSWTLIDTENFNDDYSFHLI